MRPSRRRSEALAMTIATLLSWVGGGVGGDIVSVVLAALVFAALWAIVRGLEHV